MKKLIAFIFLCGFAVAVSQAVPFGLAKTDKTEVSKVFELSAAELPHGIEVPDAPVLVHSEYVQAVKETSKTVIPQANGPPKKLPIQSYSMANWQI